MSAKHEYQFAKAKRDYKVGEPIDNSQIRRRVSWRNPNRIQASRFRFYEPPESESYLHGCYDQANIRVDVEAKIVFAKTDIKEGQDLRYEYPTTEWKYRGKKFEFTCQCGSSRCRGHFKGFKYLSDDQQKEVIESGDASAYIQKRWERRQKIKRLKEIFSVKREK